MKIISVRDKCALFFLLSITNFSRNFSIVINLVPLERYSKAQYMALVYSLKNQVKVKKNEDEKNQLLIQARYEFHFYIAGKLKDRRAQKYILLWGNFASYLQKVLWTLHFFTIQDLKNWGLHLIV